MSSDYSPRGGSNSGSEYGGSGSGGGRRRRGGRNRGGAGRSRTGTEHRPHTNGTSTSAPAKKEHPIAKLFGWLTGKKKKPSEAKPAPAPRTTMARGEFRDTPRETSRGPRTERPRREAAPKADIPAQEIVSPKLYVGNLAYEAAESDLFDLFSKVGAVKNVEVAMDRHANRSKGFGFVEMESLDTAKAAAEKLNRTDFMGRQIVVSGAKLEKRSVNKRDEETSEEPSGADETTD
jgi:hypothetical protein